MLNLQKFLLAWVLSFSSFAWSTILYRSHAGQPMEKDQITEENSVFQVSITDEMFEAVPEYLVPILQSAEMIRINQCQNLVSLPDLPACQSLQLDTCPLIKNLPLLPKCYNLRCHGSQIEAIPVSVYKAFLKLLNESPRSPQLDINSPLKNIPIRFLLNERTLPMYWNFLEPRPKLTRLDVVIDPDYLMDHFLKYDRRAETLLHNLRDLTTIHEVFLTGRSVIIAVEQEQILYNRAVENLRLRIAENLRLSLRCCLTSNQYKEFLNRVVQLSLENPLYDILTHTMDFEISDVAPLTKSPLEISFITSNKENYQILTEFEKLNTSFSQRIQVKGPTISREIVTKEAGEKILSQRFLLSKSYWEALYFDLREKDSLSRKNDRFLLFDSLLEEGDFPSLTRIVWNLSGNLPDAPIIQPSVEEVLNIFLKKPSRKVVLELTGSLTADVFEKIFAVAAQSHQHFHLQCTNLTVDFQERALDDPKTFFQDLVKKYNKLYVDFFPQHFSLTVLAPHVDKQDVFEFLPDGDLFFLPKSYEKRFLEYQAVLRKNIFSSLQNGTDFSLSIPMPVHFSFSSYNRYANKYTPEYLNEISKDIYFLNRLVGEEFDLVTSCVAKSRTFLSKTLDEKKRLCHWMHLCETNKEEWLKTEAEKALRIGKMIEKKYQEINIEALQVLAPLDGQKHIHGMVTACLEKIQKSPSLLQSQINRRCISQYRAFLRVPTPILFQQLVDEHVDSQQDSNRSKVDLEKIQKKRFIGFVESMSQGL